ncbi:unnamed protein product [Lactuca virosa]|uniref:Uncharacterized protein n=1 Tax=Lactuca virosa TaxID=75947 RepID=A0AAU9LU93_9ASTR|nr:unnamed protein product [Lactuca virosa]
MSFSGRRRRSTMYSSKVLLLVFFSVLQIWVLSSDCCKVRAIRILPSSLSKDPDDVKRLELYKKFFNGRFPKIINSTGTISKGKGFQENKRKVPSCPDALHN